MWLSFMLVGTIASICALLVQRWSRHRESALASPIVMVVVAVTGFYLFARPMTLGADQWWQRSPGREMSLFAFLLVGMAVRYVTEAIENRRNKLGKWKTSGSLGPPPGIEFDKWEFAYPLLISAITFGALLSQIKDDGLTIRNGLLGFQTGFFWQTLLAARASNVSTEVSSSKN